MCEVDIPYFTFAGWQNRAFAVPPAMGVDYRVVNGYVYISPNPVTDPELIGERAEFFQKRAGYYYANWADLYAKWRAKHSLPPTAPLEPPPPAAPSDAALPGSP